MDAIIAIIMHEESIVARFGSANSFIGFSLKSNDEENIWDALGSECQRNESTWGQALLTFRQHLQAFIEGVL
jgi:hypothetical protein